MKVVRRFALLFFSALLWPAYVVAADQPLVIVFPLENASKNSAPDWLREGVAVSLSNQLEGRELRSMDRSERIRLVENLDLPPGAALSRGSMIRVGQRAGADLIAMGSYSGTEQNLRIAVRVLNIKTLKLSGEMVANGPVSALPQNENELAWMILSNNGLEKSLTRQKFQERTRRVPNQSYAAYIESLEASSESAQLKLLLKAIGAYRDFPEAQFRLGRIYFRKGDCGSAIPHLLTGRSDSSTQPESDFMRGTCFLQLDQPLPAIQAFWRLMQGAPRFEALNNMGVAYLRKGDLSNASSTLTDARKLSHTDATVLLNMAVLLHIQGNDTAARNILEEAFKAHPQNGMINFLMGIVLKTLGENEKAEAAMAKAKSLGINVEKLQAENPAKWSRVLLSFDNR